MKKQSKFRYHWYACVVLVLLILMLKIAFRNKVDGKEATELSPEFCQSFIEAYLESYWDLDSIGHETNQFDLPIWPLMNIFPIVGVEPVGTLNPPAIVVRGYEKEWVGKIITRN